VQGDAQTVVPRCRILLEGIGGVAGEEADEVVEPELLERRRIIWLGPVGYGLEVTMAPR
jgi:hypothetical protein